MPDAVLLGKRIRAVRLKRELTQTAFADRLGISSSYLNLIENDRRPCTTALLLKLASTFDIDVRSFAGGHQVQLTADLIEAFAEPMFEEHPLTTREVREFVESQPDVARAVLRLHYAWTQAQESLGSLALRVSETQDGSQDVAVTGRVRMSSEQVSDFIERNNNHFPELEAEAERLWRDAALDRENLFPTLARHLERAHRVTVRTGTVGEMRGAVRRFDPVQRELLLSEVLRRGSRHFQLAHQIGLLSGAPILQRVLQDQIFTSDESRTLARVSLANYFASAVLMPYADFLSAATVERHNLELLGHRFRVSFEQVCHRLTMLHRPGSEGIPFMMVRVDIAGNISKKFAPGGKPRLPRFSGICPLWNVHASFTQPGIIRTQVQRLPSGETHLSVARTVRRDAGNFKSPVLYAIALACDIEYARQVMHADGLDVTNAAAVPVGLTCRTCERMECQARAFPAIQRSVTIDENVRGLSFYAPVDPSDG
ncbi:MAG TPA: short-chain fatty acyl-CoA regulator family protein [Gemmatimonadaceae bacterium]|nr:short-chain fatty acyl-CoA regulator family protein [Gemmatimonadaceae bacterium]